MCSIRKRILSIFFWHVLKNIQPLTKSYDGMLLTVSGLNEGKFSEQDFGVQKRRKM